MLEFKQWPETETWSSSTTGSQGNCCGSLVCFTDLRRYCLFSKYLKSWVQTSQEEEITRARDGRRDVPLLGENRMIHWSPATDWNWSCSFIRVQKKHPASDQNHPFQSHSFFVGLLYRPLWKASCTLKSAFQLKDLPSAQPYMPLLFFFFWDSASETP